jgi:hypothetical protein
MYYRVVASGAGIFFENYDHPEPVIGFIACRIIEATHEELAIATAKRDILVNWNQSFNADRKLGMPRLFIEDVKPLNRWFKPRIKHDYYWFTSSEHKQQQLEKFTSPPSLWFWRK